MVPSISGSRAGYHWFQSAQLFLYDLLAEIPSLVVGRFVAVTSFDSGPLRPSEEEIRTGWTSNDSVAYSPRITDQHDVPHDQYDEWYVFQNPSIVRSPEVFVNFGAFGLQSPDYILKNVDPTWDRGLAKQQHDFVADYQERFWNQLAGIEPESYLAEGDNLICVTRNKTIFQALDDFFRGDRPQSDT